MRKFFDSKLTYYLFGFISAIGIVSVFAYSYFAQDIGFTPTDSEWKNSNGTDLGNVSNALENLYSRIKDDDFVIPNWIVNTAGNSVAYGFLYLPDLSPYRKLSIDSLSMSSGSPIELSLQNSSGTAVISFTLQGTRQEYDIKDITGTGYSLIAYGSGLSNWGTITYRNIVLSK